tara:strand:- start:19014 stop:19415 length:402 start_codon:yes stop_codon:yes gene_type:complete
MGRVVLPNYPHHIVQRGHNRQVVFACAEDFQRYLSDMGELKEAFHIKLYAWCLMTNHVHLLVCPESAAGLGQFMKSLAARATRYRNRLMRVYQQEDEIRELTAGLRAEKAHVEQLQRQLEFTQEQARQRHHDC